MVSQEGAHPYRNVDALQGEQTIPRMAVVGSGYWGKNLVRVLHDLHALAAICDSNPEQLRTFGDLYPGCRITGSFAEVLKDDTIEAVAIATPAESHADMVNQALLAAKDVFVEKPLSLSVPRGRALVDLAREKGRILMVGHVLWYHPAILKLKEIIDAGELGRINYIYSNRLNLGVCRKNQESQKTGNAKSFDATEKLVRGQMWAKIFSTKSLYRLFRQAPRLALVKPVWENQIPSSPACLPAPSSYAT